jgi:hypothetical protein
MSFHAILEQECNVLGFSYAESNLERKEMGSSRFIFHFARHINWTLHCFRFMEVHVTVHVKLKWVHLSIYVPFYFYGFELIVFVKT